MQFVKGLSWREQKQDCWGGWGAGQCKAWKTSLERIWGGSRMSNEGCEMKKELIDFYIYPIWWDKSPLKWANIWGKAPFLIPFNYITDLGSNPREWQLLVSFCKIQLETQNVRWSSARAFQKTNCTRCNNTFRCLLCL